MALNPIDPFRADITGRLRWLRDRDASAWAVLLLVPAFLVVAAVVAAIEGNLRIADWPAVVWDDVRRLINVHDNSGARPNFPLGRDSVSLAVAALQAANIAIVFRQWRLFERFHIELNEVPTVLSLVKLDGQGRVATDRQGREVDGTADFNSSIGKLNRLIGHPTVGATALVLGLIGAVLALNLVNAASVFADLAPTDLNDGARVAWSETAFDSWWARGDSGRIVFILFAWVAFYFIILQNFVGFSLAGFFWTKRKNLRLGADTLNSDDAHGWSPLGNVLVTVYQSLTINTVSLLLLIIVLQGRRPGGLWPASALLLVGSVVYLLVPFLILSRGLRSFRKDRSATILSDLDTALNTGLMPYTEPWILARNAAREELQEVQSVSAFPFRRRLVVALLVNALPVAVAVLEILRVTFGAT